MFYTNNKGAVNLTQTTIYYKYSKYIIIKYHWTQKMVKKKYYNWNICL